jgi:hypothetical protein
MLLTLTRQDFVQFVQYLILSGFGSGFGSGTGILSQNRYGSTTLQPASDHGRKGIKYTRTCTGPSTQVETRPQARPLQDWRGANQRATPTVSKEEKGLLKWKKNYLVS